MKINNYTWLFITTMLLSIFTNQYARELRTPLNLQRGWGHFYVDFEMDYDERRIFDWWDVDVWAGGYHKTAFDAFPNCEGNCPGSIANLFFCSPAFTLAQSFFDSTVVVPGNPFVNIAFFEPQLTYNEDGIVLGTQIQRRFSNDRWRAGLRAVLPLRRIEMRVDSLGLDADTGLEQVGARRNEVLNGVVYNDVYAYRLDFLSALPVTLLTGELLVNYVDPLTSNHITINNQDLTDANNNPVHVISRPDGTLPVLLQWTDLDTDPVPFVQADGSGIVANGRGRFSAAINYGPLSGNIAAQRQLFVVPTVDDPQITDVLSQPSGDPIRTAIGNALRNVTGQTALDFLEAAGIDLGTQHTVGIGDFDTELYVGYDVHEQFYIEGEFAVRWPTGKKNRDPQRVFFITRGNNGHFEVRGGLTGIWRPRQWFASRAFVSYTGVLEHDEQIAATFSGATIKGIGPTTTAKIKWNYFWGLLDFTFYHPKCQDIGFDVGYEAYVKQHDEVDFCVEEATDFVGQTHLLNPCLAECNTRVISHKIRLEAFLNWYCGSIFAGFSHVVAGENAMRESEWHLGMEVRF